MIKTALITGATSGIGAAFARELAAKGYHLGLVGRRTEMLQSLADELAAKYGIRAEAITADLSTEIGQKLAAEWILTHSPLDLLINNAGFGIPGTFATTSAEDHLSLLSVHADATVRLTRVALPAMIEAGRGAIINVSSPAAYLPMSGNVMYASTKAFLNVFSEALRAELRGTGVFVQTLLPGFTYSDFHKRGEYAKYDFYSTLPKWAWMTSESVAQKSLRALERGNPSCIPGLHNQIVVFLAKTGVAGLFLNRTPPKKKYWTREK
jgi:short-subunit dehydrogenase